MGEPINKSRIRIVKEEIRKFLAENKEKIMKRVIARIKAEYPEQGKKQG